MNIYVPIINKLIAGEFTVFINAVFKLVNIGKLVSIIHIWNLFSCHLMPKGNLRWQLKVWNQYFVKLNTQLKSNLNAVVSSSFSLSSLFAKAVELSGRIISKSTFDSHADPIFKELELLKLADIRQLVLGKLMFCFNHSLLHSKFKSTITFL